MNKDINSLAVTKEFVFFSTMTDKFIYRINKESKIIQLTQDIFSRITDMRAYEGEINIPDDAGLTVATTEKINEDDETSIIVIVSTASGASVLLLLLILLLFCLLRPRRKKVKKTDSVTADTESEIVYDSTQSNSTTANQSQNQNYDNLPNNTDLAFKLEMPPKRAPLPATFIKTENNLKRNTMSKFTISKDKNVGTIIARLASKLKKGGDSIKYPTHKLPDEHLEYVEPNPPKKEVKIPGKIPFTTHPAPYGVKPVSHNSR